MENNTTEYAMWNRRERAELLMATAEEKNVVQW